MKKPTSEGLITMAEDMGLDVEQFLEFCEDEKTKLDVRRMAEASAQRERDAIDAAKWRALMSCDRIRLIGCSGNDFHGRPNHVGIEFHIYHDAGDAGELGRVYLDKLVERAGERHRAQQASLDADTHAIAREVQP